MTLRPYQKKYYEDINKAARYGKKKIMVHLATGGGKSVIFQEIIKNAINKNKNVLFLVSGNTILYQAVKKYFKNLTDSVSIMQGNQKYEFSQILACSIDTLYRRKKVHEEIINKYDVIVVDECHDCTAPRYLDFLNQSKSFVIGFTATPYNVGKKTHDFWEAVVKNVSVKELVDQGFLMKPRVFSVEIMNTDVKKRRGDYDNKQLFEKNNELKVYSDIIKEWTDKAYGLKTLCFAINKDHGKSLCKQFNDNNIPAAYADSDTPLEEREALIQKLIKKEILVLVNIDIFTKGVDIPELECGIFARPTRSKTVWVQQAGRILRIHPDVKDCIILDCGANTENVGHILEDFQADVSSDTLIIKGATEESSESKRNAIFKKCKLCFFINEMKNEKCESCGEPLKTEREIKEEKEKELKEIEFKEKQKEAKKKRSTLEAWIKRHGTKKFFDYAKTGDESLLTPELEEILSLINEAKKKGWKNNALFFKIYDINEETEYFNFPSWFTDIKEREKNEQVQTAPRVHGGSNSPWAKKLP